MQKRLWSVALVLVLLIPLAVAIDSPTSPPPASGPEGGGSGGDVAPTTEPDSTTKVANSDIHDVGGGGKPSDNLYTTQAGTVIDASDFPAGTKFEVNGKDVFVNGQKISGATTIKYEGGKIVSDGATTIIADGTQDMQATSVGTFQAGPIVITNGKNVNYVDGCLTADSADSLIETDTVATKLDTVEYCDKTIDVKEADSVWAGCVYMEDVENAEITAKTEVEIKADKDSDFSIKDCATNNYDFTALSDDASLTLSKNTVEPTLELHDVLIELEKNNVTETVATNSTAEVVVSRIDGMQIIRMKPVTTYTYDAGNPEQDFSVRAWQSNHDLYLRKNTADQLPAEIKTCVACSIFDFPNHGFEIRGVIDFNKPQLFKTTSTEPLPFFTTANANAKAILTFDNDNAFINDILILNDAPPYKTIISNYLTIEEAIQRGDKTERLLTINEKITKDKLSTSWIKTYRTSYNPASMKIDNNELNYQRNGVVLSVFPPGHKMIATLLESLKGAHATLFASFALLVTGFVLSPAAASLRALMRRNDNRARKAKPEGERKGKESKNYQARKVSRGQLTIFMLLGIIMLAAVMFLLVFTFPSQVHIKNQNNVQDYVSDCLKLSGDQSLKAFGLQGGHLALQTPFYQTPPTAFDFNQGTNNLLPLERMELDIGEDTKNRVITCLDNFKAFTGVTVETIGSPSVRTILGLKETTFILDYRFFVNRNEDRWEFKDFSTTVPKSVLVNVNAANATIQSEVQNEGRINLDALPSATYTFFPGEEALLALIEANDFQFFFANKR